MTYRRTAAQRQADFQNAKEFESEVAEKLGDWIHTRFESTTDLDIWSPGYYLDVKEKRQKLGARWHLLEGVPERDLFVIDELSIRKGLEKAPEAYFLIRDVPGGRLFLTSVIHVAMGSRVRRNRIGKGKWIINLGEYRQIARVEDVPEIIRAELVSMPWRNSECLSLTGEVPQI